MPRACSMIGKDRNSKGKYVKIALAQTNPTVGDLNGNAGKIRTAYAEAQNRGADLVVFTELALCGYPPKDLLHKSDFIERNLSALMPWFGTFRDRRCCWAMSDASLPGRANA